MIKIRIISAGKTRQKHLAQGEEDYIRRTSSFMKIDRLELGMEAASSLSESEAKKREGAAILDKLKPDEFVIVLDEQGVEMSSRKLAAFFEDKTQRGISAFCFIIGGACGLDESVKKRAGLILSLSRLTFPYQLTRLILIEQLYRAFTIMKGIRYHK